MTESVPLSRVLREEIKALDDIPPSIQTQANIRLINAVHKAAAALDDMQMVYQAVLAWWEENKFEVVDYGEDEKNLYDEPPDFVGLVQASIARAERE
ncbi:hypothetical protein [Manganibacter manganicus]|uniref:Uncharacterized protein n=1 Tax=Manganibacter manganicus TaxID=1873176 RepID=A0A1V8RP22_9HYPH|nr:hypothetical protein [Pseudaminobacter manganicus]OQM74940.1 hypothetical protein BFN67_04815 [Pseudaminobacter manganicus]